MLHHPRTGRGHGGTGQLVGAAMRVIAAFADPHPVDLLAVSRDGRLAALAGGGVVALWDLLVGRPVWSGPFRPASQLAFSPDGTQVAAGYPIGHIVRPTDGSAD